MATTSATTAGLDVNSIVSQLMTIERQPIAKLDAKTADYQAKLTSYGTIKGAVSAFQTAISSLNNTTRFQSLKATSSDSSALSASVSSIATAGTYSLEVTNLAQAQSLIAVGQASTTAAIGTGATTTVTFDFGTVSGGTFTAYDPIAKTGGTYSGSTFSSSGNGTTSITINNGNNTLSGIRDAINGANMGVTASIINDGNATTPYRLVLSSNSLGADHSMKISVSGDANVSSLLAHDPGTGGTQNLAETLTAKNANILVNGVAVSNNSNTISDAIHGVTLNLTNKTSGPIKLTVARDTSTISTSMVALVKAYNDMQGIFNSAISYNATTNTAATLQGDFTVRNLQDQMRRMLTSAVPGTSGALRSFSDMGVSVQRDGTLALDQTKLDSAMSNNYADMATIFSSNNGVLTQLGTLTQSALAGDGSLATRTDGIGRSVAAIAKRRADLEVRLVTIESRYRTQYTTLDSLLTSMNTTSTYLTQQLAKL